MFGNGNYGGINRMAKVKGTGKDILIRVLNKYGPNMYQQYLELLPAHLREKEKNTSGTKSMELDKDEENNTLIIAAKFLYPLEDKKLRRLGKEMALYGFSIVYKMFFAIPSLTYLFKKVAVQWSHMYDTGAASIENIKENSATVVVRDFPDMPAYLREYLCGFYEGMATLNGAKNPRVKKDDSNPQEWHWELKWD